MGDPWKKKQIKDADRREEKAMRDAAEPRLFRAPALANARLILKPNPGVTYATGETLAVMADETCLRVVRNGYEAIGVIEGESAVLMREYFAAKGGSNVLPLQVMEVATLSGMAQAEAVEN